MAQLTKAAFLSKWSSLFADNSTREISEEDLRNFRLDISESFLSIEDNFIDEDDFSSDSATKAPSQQSTKAYIASQIAGGSGAVSGSLVAGRVVVATGTNTVDDYDTLTFDGTKLAIGNIAPDSILHAYESSAGSVAAPTGTIGTFERNGAAYITLLTPDANERGIIFGEASDNDAGAIYYNTSGTNDGFEVRANGATRVWLTSAGKLGIGRTPVRNFDVYASSGSSQMVLETAGTTQSEFILKRTGGTASEWSIYLPTGSTELRLYSTADKFAFTTAGVFKILTTPSTDNTATPLAIDGSGNVVKKTDVIDGAGATGRIPYFTDTNTISSDSGLTWDEMTNTLTTGSLSATSVSISSGSIESGTYTPTGSAVNKVTSVTPDAAQYLRVGSVVTVSGRVTVDITSAGSSVRWELSCPITTSHSTSSAGGTFDQDDVSNGGVIKGTSGTNNVRFTMNAASSGSNVFYYHFTYRII